MDVFLVPSLCGKKFMKKRKELSYAVSDLELTIDGIQVLSSDDEF